MESLSPLEILTAIRNTTGPRTALFVPDISFELLVKRQIRRLEEPSLCCVELVHEELLRIARHCGFEIERFPRLFERINEIIKKLLNDRLAPTKEFVSHLVDIELAYINSKHPEFADSALINILKEHPAAPVDGSQAENDASPEDPLARSKVSKIAPPLSKKKTTQMPPMNISAVNANESTTINNTKTGLGFWPFARSTKSSITAESTEAEAAKRHGFEHSRGLNAKEKLDCAVIERLIRSYFNIVRKTVQDLVPKSIMNFLVNNVRDNLQSELVRELYNAPDLDELLSESDQMTSRRKETAEMLVALKKANSVISDIREAHF